MLESLVCGIVVVLLAAVIIVPATINRLTPRMCGGPVQVEQHPSQLTQLRPRK